MGPERCLDTATGWLITQGARIRILSSLPAETRPEGFAPRGCHAAREDGSNFPVALGPLHPGFVRSDSQKPTTAESCPVHVLCSNDSYASKRVKRSPLGAGKCLRRRAAAFT